MKGPLSIEMCDYLFFCNGRSDSHEGIEALSFAALLSHNSIYSFKGEYLFQDLCEPVHQTLVIPKTSSL